VAIGSYVVAIGYAPFIPYRAKVVEVVKLLDAAKENVIVLIADVESHKPEVKSILSVVLPAFVSAPKNDLTVLYLLVYA
jgi:hypothetical protein